MNYQKILNTILYNWKLLLKTVVFTTILIFLILLLIYPITYSSPVTILPPEKTSNMGGLSSLIAGGDFSNLLAGNFNATSQLYMEILKSRSAAEYVCRKHNLKEFYGAEDFEGAVEKLQNHVDIILSKEGIIKLEVEISTSLFPLFGDQKMRAKKLSADVSNSYMQALDVINRAKVSSKAKNARVYIEEQLTKTRLTLDSVESNLMSFQKINKAISLPDQVKTSIEAASKIKAEMIQTEMEIGLAQTNFREDNRSLLLLKSKLSQLRDQYSKLEVGSPDYLLTFNEVPELGKKLANLLREVKIQNEVYILLQQQYYKEKIQENKDTPTVEILDKAITPKKAVSPRKSMLSILGGICSFITVLVFLLYSEQKGQRIIK